VCLGAATYALGGIRLYFAALVAVCLVPAAAIFVWRSTEARRWSLALATAAMVAISIGSASMWIAKLQRWAVSAATPLVARGSNDVDPSPSAQVIEATGSVSLSEIAVDQVQRSRLRFVAEEGATNIAAGSDATGGIVRSTLVGLATIFVPISVVKALAWVDFAGGRGLLWITDVDTVLFDVFILSAVVLVVAGRRRIGPNAPYVWFLACLGILVTVLLGFVVTNYGTLVRLRVMAAVPLWMLPLAVARSSGDRSSDSALGT
jgi:hypothetical protein